MGDWQCTGPPLPMGGSSADIVVNSKRQRRPSVRLGEIGDQSAAYAYSSQDLIRRKKQKQWNQPSTGFFRNASDFPGGSGKLSKTRPLLNISSDEQVILDDPISHCGFPSDEARKMQLNPICVNKKLRHGRTRRRGVGLVGKMTRTMRVSPESNNNGQDKGSGDDNGFGASYDVDTPECFKDSDLDTSGSPVKETCTIHLDSPDSRPVNLGSSECHHTVGEVSGNEREEETWAHNNKESTEYGNGSGLNFPSDSNTRSKQDAMRDRNGDDDKKLVSISAAHYLGMVKDVRAWLNGLGLGRYAELFELHEVEKDVLPLLTLDDLKEMGINAVGARRKIYSAIQKLGKRFAV